MVEEQPKVFRFEKVNEVLEGRLLSIKPSRFGNVYGILTIQSQYLGNFSG